MQLWLPYNYAGNSVSFLLSTAGEEKKLGTNTILLMSLRFTYLGWLSIHIMACIWYALPCSNAASSLLSADLCRSGTWADLPGKGPLNQHQIPSFLCLNLLGSHHLHAA